MPRPTESQIAGLFGRGALVPPEPDPGVVSRLLGKAAEVPGVGAAMQVVSDPRIQLAMSVGPAALVRYDNFGRRIPVSAETGQARSLTSQEARQQAQLAEAAAIRNRRPEFESGPLRSVGFRNERTGEVVAGGFTHPSSQGVIPPKWNQYGDVIEDGFITKDGRFLTRREAGKLVGFNDPVLGDQLESMEANTRGLFGAKVPMKQQLQWYDEDIKRFRSPTPSSAEAKMTLDEPLKPWMNKVMADLIRRGGK